MTASSTKARASRLERLQAMLDGQLAQPASALETLMAELGLGEAHLEQWESLHAAAARDGTEAELADAYRKLTAPHRLKELSQPERIGVLVHAADFHQGILGDGETAGGFLRTVLSEVPGHSDAFDRLERRLQAIGDRLRLTELYADAVGTPAMTPDALATKVVNTVARLTADTPLSDEVCQRLLPLASASYSVLGTLEAHCKKTDRFALLAALIAVALAQGMVPKAHVVERRHRLIDLYLGEAKQPAKALPYVEELLQADPTDSYAKEVANRLLAVHEVASHAAAVLQEARRRARPPK